MSDLPEPVTWQLLEFLAERVRLVARDRGFHTDIGAGLIILDDADSPAELGVPATAIAVDRVSFTAGGRKQSTSDVGVTIEFSVPRGMDEENPHRLVHRARHDLIRVLNFDERSMPLGITSFTVSESQLTTVADESGHSSVIAQITARAGLTEIFTSVSNP